MTRILVGVIIFIMMFVATAGLYIHDKKVEKVKVSNKLLEEATEASELQKKFVVDVKSLLSVAAKNCAKEDQSGKGKLAAINYQECLWRANDEEMNRIVEKYWNETHKSKNQFMGIADGMVKNLAQTMSQSELKNPILDFRPACQTYLTPEASSVENKVIGDAIAQYFIVKRSGNDIDRCLQAEVVAQTYLQAEDEENYTAWRRYQQANCR